MVAFFTAHCCRAIEVKGDTRVMCGLRIGHDGPCKPALVGKQTTTSEPENSWLLAVRAGAVDAASGVKCGWANGYGVCEVPGCTFAAWKTDERCLLVRREAEYSQEPAS
jgi:hypothetical protein